MRMVKLTALNGEEMFVAPEHVTYVALGANHTRIYFSGRKDDFVCAQESPQTVVNLLETGYKNRKPSRTCL